MAYTKDDISIGTYICVFDLINQGYARYVEEKPKKKYGEIKGDYIIILTWKDKEGIDVNCFEMKEEMVQFWKQLIAFRKIWQWCEDCKKENPLVGDHYEVYLDGNNKLGVQWVADGFYSPFHFATNSLGYQCLEELHDEWLIWFERKE